MGVPADRARYTDIYLQEVAELTQALEQTLLGLEAADDAPDRLRSAMRAAHTLKGSANTMGLPRTVEVAHAMESLIQAVREGRAEATSHVIDMLLHAVDATRDLARGFAGGAETELDATELIAALRAAAGEPEPERGPADAAEGAPGAGTEAEHAPLAAPACVRHVTFSVAGAQYALPAADVLEITPPKTIVACPGVAECVLGLTNLRGRVTPVLDVALRLGTDALDEGRGVLIVVPYGEERVALKVCAIGGLIDVAPDEMDRAAAAAATESDAVAGVARTRGGLVVVLDRERLLDLRNL